MIVDVNLPQKIETKLGGEYNVESVINDDGTQTLNINYVGSAGENKVTQIMNNTVVSLSTEDLKGVTNIKDYIFRNCTSLENVELPNTIESIGSYAFYGCTGLTEFKIPDSVTTIGSYVFNSCSNLDTLYMGNGVTSIGSNSFVSCPLSKMYIHDLEHWFNNAILDMIGVIRLDEIYLNNELIEDVIVPDTVTTIPRECFIYVKSIKSVTISDSVTRVMDSAFSECENLETVTFGDNIELLNTHVFARSTKLNKLINSDKVGYVNSSCFQDCTGLTGEISFLNATQIKNYAFAGCKNISSFVLGEVCTTISASAFRNCSNLRTLTIKATTPPSLANTNAISTATTTIYIPKGTLEAYSTATNWSSFASKFVEKEM